MQVLTEKAFLDRTGQRTGATAAGTKAQRFAEQVTRLLTSLSVPRRARLVGDFRVIELAKVLHYERIPVESLVYLLHHYPLAEVHVPTVVGGIFHDEQGQVVCERTFKKVATGLLYKQRVQRYSYGYCGGVEARGELSTAQFSPDSSGILATLVSRVRAARPADHALVWQIAS
jgi:hypothetical protein